MKVVIADTSCLIIYDKIDKLYILKNTFRELIVTPQVADEFGDLPDWIYIKELENQAKFIELARDLGKGEASSIVLAIETGNSLLVIDEKKGRKIAADHGVEIIGSLGVLLKAKQKKVIDSVKDIIDAIEQTNFRISKAIKEELLKQADE
jgi:predicted nucleic acid-binding protein